MSRVGLVGIPLLVWRWRPVRPSGRLALGLHAVRALGKSKRRAALYLSDGLARGVGGRRKALSLSAGLAQGQCPPGWILYLHAVRGRVRLHGSIRDRQCANALHAVRGRGAKVLHAVRGRGSVTGVLHAVRGRDWLV